MVYYEYVQQLRTEVSSELEFHMKKADRSFCPRCRGFNSLYKRYCEEEFGGENGNKMFDHLVGKISEYKEKHPSCKLSYQLFDPERSKPLIIATVTPFFFFFSTITLYTKNVKQIKNTINRAPITIYGVGGKLNVKK